MSVAIQITRKGYRAFERHVKRAERQFRKEKRKKLRAAVVPIRRDAKTIARSKLRRRSGDLFKSIKFRVRIRGRRGTAEVSVGKFYGKFHEFGTSKHPRRAFLQPAVDKNEENTFRILGQSLKVIG